MKTKKETIDDKIESIEERITDTVKEIAGLINVEYSEELKREIGKLIAFVNIRFEFTKEKYAGLIEKYWPEDYEL